MPDIDHEYTNNIVCPWCGYEDLDSWDYAHGEECFEIECGSCEKAFDVERNMTIHYNTIKLGE